MNWTPDLWIPRSDALPLSHSNSAVSKGCYKIHMTSILHTARISNVDSVSLESLWLSGRAIGAWNLNVWGLIPHGDSEIFLCPMLMIRWKTSFSIPLPSSKLILSLILFISNTINQIMFDIMASFIKHKEWMQVRPNCTHNLNAELMICGSAIKRWRCYRKLWRCRTFFWC